MSKNRNFRTPLLPALLVLGLIAPSAQAATVILDGSGDIALGIQGLAYDGMVYDVTFVPDTPGNIYGVPPNLDLDFDSSSVVEEVIAVVNAALETSTATKVGTESFSNGEYRIAYNYSLSRGEFDTWGGENAALGNWNTAPTDTVSPDTINDVYAVFAPVPIPAAVWLFGSALLGLVGMARRSKA